ncbi:hypothetical protein [Gemmatimonas sp. UBA7669]|uniref:hypothetical protein n=1 Tax=Gemmatimonas sp. UBA7669 TaxID=1946568 RepID=UPI0025BA933C|nr:hypothetical protein [Gemmatimonas sp. UBA7669]
MKERPILFSGQMVRAILDGRKSMTRRVVKPPKRTDLRLRPNDIGCTVRDDGAIWHDAFGWLHCPYGVPGDLLWVRETFAPFSTGGAVYRADKPRFSPDAHEVVGGSWHPSIYMPRWASRLTLRITDVRVERLQDISADDCRAEGHPTDWSRSPAPEVHDDAARDWYRDLWDSINGSGAWDANPWVWVVAFERVEVHAHG